MFIFASINGCVLGAEELGPYYPNTPSAPLEVRKGETPSMSLSKDEAKEITSEFGGILYMGVHNYTYEKWPGKEMSDCQKGTSESWCYQCEMITGHANTYYTFYNDPVHHSCTLQQMDAHFQVADSAILKDLKRPVRSLLGDATYDVKSDTRDPEWNGSGNAWKWKTDRDLAYLYMDSEEMTSNGEGQARFQWRRSPLFDPYSPLTQATHHH